MSDIKEIIGDLIILWDLLKPTVSCQNQLPEKNEEKTLSDLQIVGFWGSIRARTGALNEML